MPLVWGGSLFLRRARLRAHGLGPCGLGLRRLFSLTDIAFDSTSTANGNVGSDPVRGNGSRHERYPTVGQSEKFKGEIASKLRIKGTPR